MLPHKKTGFVAYNPQDTKKLPFLEIENPEAPNQRASSKSKICKETTTRNQKAAIADKGQRDQSNLGQPAEKRNQQGIRENKRTWQVNRRSATTKRDRLQYATMAKIGLVNKHTLSKQATASIKIMASMTDLLEDE